MRRKSLRSVPAAGFLVFLFALAGVFFIHKANIDVPYLCYSGPDEGIWSIGIYDLEAKGRSLKLHAHQDNPVLTAADVRDTPARFVADPFLVREEGKYYLFFETLGVDRGVISLAASEDGRRWRYERVVLEEPFHLSYPNVFRWNGEYYMVPESIAVNSVRLYKAKAFPGGWEFVKTVVADRPLVDSTVLCHQGVLWMFSSSPDNRNLFLFYADRPEGPWREHPRSPIVRDNGRDARPAGNILDVGNRLIRLSQDSQEHGERYGKAVRGFEIVTLTRQEYREHPLEENPLLEGSGTGWNGMGMHQISAWPEGIGRWLVAADGKRRSDQYVFCLGKSIYRW